MAAKNDVTNPNLQNVATAQLAVDREIKKRPITQSAVLVEEEANGPNLPWFEGALGTDLPPNILGAAFTCIWIEL